MVNHKYVGNMNRPDLAHLFPRLDVRSSLALTNHEPSPELRFTARFSHSSISPESLKMGPLELQERNVDVFDSGGVVIAGTVYPSHWSLCSRSPLTTCAEF